jgi:hypothetical protein
MARNTRGSAMLGPGPRRIRGLGKRSPYDSLIVLLRSFHARVRTNVQRERASYHFLRPEVQLASESRGLLVGESADP